MTPTQKDEKESHFFHYEGRIGRAQGCYTSSSIATLGRAILKQNNNKPF